MNSDKLLIILRNIEYKLQTYIRLTQHKYII